MSNSRDYYVIGILFILFIFASGYHWLNEKPIRGTYTGSVDGRPSEIITMDIHLDENGTGRGVWKSNTAYGNGEIRSKVGWLGSTLYTLTVLSGVCKGEVGMTLLAAESKILGALDGGRNCTDRRFQFTVSPVPPASTQE